MAARSTRRLDWGVIRCRCESGDVGLREIARILGINPNTVRQRCRREDWQIPKHRVRNPHGRQAQALARAATEQTLAPIRDHFAQLGTLTRNQLAHLILNAVEELRKLNGLDLLANIQGLSVVTRAACQVHGWDDCKQLDHTAAVNLQVLACSASDLEKLTRQSQDAQSPVREISVSK